MWMGWGGGVVGRVEGCVVVRGSSESLMDAIRARMRWG